MTYFRSETMAFCEGLMPRESAWNIMDRLGRLDMIHIVPSAQSFESQFAKNLKRCDEALTRIDHIKQFLQEFDARKLTPYKDTRVMFEDFNQMIADKKVPGAAFMNEVEEEVMKTVSFFDQQKQEFDRIKEQKNTLIQRAALSLSMYDVIKVKELFYDSMLGNESMDGRRGSSRLQHKMGLIHRKDQLILQKLIFRTSRGNAWMQTFEVKRQEMNKVFDDPADIESIKGKIIFLILFQSGEYMIVENKINRVLNSFDCYVQQEEEKAPVGTLVDSLRIKENEISGLYRVTKENIRHYVDYLYASHKFSEHSYLIFIEAYTIKEKAIYEALTQCTTINNFLSFKCFIPKSKLSELDKLKEARGDIPSFMVTLKEPERAPPSKFLQCEMIEIPQEIVNTYGVPTYQQFNPAPLYIVTFGLFIGIMFGDVGHMLLVALLVLMIRPNKWWWTVVFWMGFCGVIYNEFFGINLGLFKSCYRIENGVARKQHQHCVYPFGLDPIWKVSSNQMSFTNSYKMKLSVIIGVLHMSFGIILKGVNSLRKRNYIDLFAIVIPQLTFMSCTFVYMDALIIIKWLTNHKDTSNAPSIINTLIGMFVSNTHKAEFFSSQAVLQQFLMILAVLLVPFLLLAKPLIMWVTGNGFEEISVINSEERLQNPNFEEEIAKEMRMESEVQELDSLVPPNDSQNHDVHNYKQLMIHQLIETIEFVLGTVSNTASYLRLWALSLAHGQLSEVFFNLMVEGSLVEGYSSSVKLVVAFAIFVSVSFGVLVGMDVMECFLHSLRLHWVQFQNKFFSGSGYIFNPFSFQKEIKAYLQE